MTINEFNALFHRAIGPKCAGAPYPEFDPAAINESKIPYDLRYKEYSIDFEYKNTDISKIKIDWMSQSWDEDGLKGFKAEIERCFKHIGYKGDVEIHVYDRDGEEDRILNFAI